MFFMLLCEHKYKKGWLSCNHNTGEVETGVKASLYYVVTSRLAWDT